MKSFPPVVKETGLLLRSSTRRKPFPIRTMEIKTAVHNKTNIYCNLHAHASGYTTKRMGKGCSVNTKLSKTLRAKIKAIVDATLKNPKQKNKTWQRKSYHKRIIPFEAQPVRMPVFPPGANAGVDSYRTVKLYILDKQQVWLHRDDLEWALRYMFLEIFPRWRMGEDSRCHAPIPWRVEAP